MDVPYKSFFTSPAIAFLVGEKGVSFTNHEELVKHHSDVLYACFNSDMREGIDKRIRLEDADVDTFARVGDYIYRGNYGNEELKATSNPPSATPKVKENGSLEDQTDDDSWGRSLSKKKKKVNKGFGWGEFGDDVPVEAPVKTKTQQFWDKFKSKRYTFSTRTPEQISGQDTHGSVSDVILCHARVYVFAHRYMIPNLEQIALYKLHKALVRLAYSQDKAQDIITLIDFAYENTDTKCGSMDPLRELIIEYATANVEALDQEAEFRRLKESNPSMCSELCTMMMQRLD